MSCYWKIPPQEDASYVAAMEDVLRVYSRPYDPQRPVVCMDETCKQLVGEVRQQIPMSPGQSLRVDDEYVRNGVAEIFMAVEPLAGWRAVRAGEHRGRVEWAHFMRELPAGRYAAAERVVLVMDNLNTHEVASLYQAFPPAEAERLARRLELHYTPKHGSWLNIAEIELSVYKRQCISGRIATLELLEEMTRRWNEDRNSRQGKVDWQFWTEEARWEVETLFKELKQTLQLRDFYGENENAVKWQVWTALLAHLLLRVLAWQSRWRGSCTRFVGVV